MNTLQIAPKNQGQGTKRERGRQSRFPEDRQLPCGSVTPMFLPIKKIGGVSKETLCKDLGCEVCEDVKDLVAHHDFVVSPVEMDVCYIALSARDLGFVTAPLTQDFMTDAFCTQWSRTNPAGFIIKLCERGDGLEIRRLYRNQPEGETLTLAMNPAKGLVHVEDSILRVIRHVGGKRKLRSFLIAPSVRWRLNGDKFVFRFEGKRPSS